MLRELAKFATWKMCQVLKMHKGLQVLNFFNFLQCARTLVSAASALTCSYDIILPQSSCADEKHLSLSSKLELPARAHMSGLTTRTAKGNVSKSENDLSLQSVTGRIKSSVKMEAPS